MTLSRYPEWIEGEVGGSVPLLPNANFVPHWFSSEVFFTFWREMLIYFIAAGIGIYARTNVVNWLDKDRKNLPAPLPDAVIMKYSY